MHVACKTFHIDGGAGNFRREFRRLGWVKEAKEDIRIMKHIAALVHGSNVMILLPMAEHFDLDVFLRHGSKPTRDTEGAEKLYDFDTRFPDLKDDELGAALVKELCEVASAVHWLHEGNEASQSLYRSLAHMDLKPENILVAEDPSSSIGKWMLSDFGVSLFSQEVSRGQSGRTTASSYLDEPRRGCGTYQPPEIKQIGIDGRKCDVWSFGCILIDVMAFALGRTDLFQDVRALRNCGGDDFFYQTKISRRDSQTAITNANTKLKPQIKNWLKDQKRSAKHPRWVRCYIGIIESTLKCDPQNRPKIESVVCALSELRRDTAAFGSESASARPNGRVLQINTAGFDEAHEMGSRDVGGVSVDSETSFDTDSASLSTTGQIVSYSPLSEHAGSQFDSRDSFGRDDQHSIVTNSSGPHALGLHRASIATDGSGSIQIGLDPELRSPTPTRLTLRLGVQSSQDRPRNVKSSPEEISRTSLPVKDTGKIIALALSPSGDRAALLFRHACRVYLSGDIVTENIFIKLKRNAQWTRLCIGSQYLVVYGTERGKVFQNRALVFDTHGGLIVWEFNKEIQGVQVSDVIISAEGVAAGAYENHLLIHDLSKNEDRTFPLEQGLIIKNLAFSANGRWLCAWAISIDQGCDRSYFWEISQQSIDLRGSGSYRRVDDASTSFFLWCYPDTPACVIHERHFGLTSVLQPNDPNDPNDPTDQNPESRQDLGIPGLLNACITPRNSLIYVVKPSILSRRRETRFEERLLTSDQTLATGISKEGTTHGAVGSRWENTAVAVAAQSESTELITLCTFSRNLAEVVKYRIDYG